MLSKKGTSLSESQSTLKLVVSGRKWAGRRENVHILLTYVKYKFEVEYMVSIHVRPMYARETAVLSLAMPR